MIVLIFIGILISIPACKTGLVKPRQNLQFFIITNKYILISGIFLEEWHAGHLFAAFPRKVLRICM
jgi:hypothetical protein